MPEERKNGKQSCRKDWLNKEKKNFKNRENIEREREVSGQDGRFENLQFFVKIYIFNIFSKHFLFHVLLTP